MNKKMEFSHNGKNLILYYDDNYFKITTDNLALANFIKIKSKDKLLVEFGSGLLSIPLLLSTRTDIEMIGIEKPGKTLTRACEKQRLVLSALPSGDLPCPGGTG